MSERLQFGRLSGTIGEVVDAGFDLLPPFEQASIPVLDGAERPAEWPEIKRRLRAEGIRLARHRGVILLEPGELERFSSVGLFTGANHGASELYLISEWRDELEPFPGRVSSDLHDLSEGTPLGLEEWMADAGALLALGDGDGLNFATTDAELAERLRSHFKSAVRR